MIVIYCSFCILLALFSIPFALAAIHGSHGLEKVALHQKLYHALVVFMAVSFPILNIISAIEFYVYQTKIMSYVIAVYGFIFICLYFIDTKFEKDLRG